jgi:hypothetical protein
MSTLIVNLSDKRSETLIEALSQAKSGSRKPLSPYDLLVIGVELVAFRIIGGLGRRFYRVVAQQVNTIATERAKVLGQSFSWFRLYHDRIALSNG